VATRRDFVGKRQHVAVVVAETAGSVTLTITEAGLPGNDPGSREDRACIRHRSEPLGRRRLIDGSVGRETAVPRSGHAAVDPRVRPAPENPRPGTRSSQSPGLVLASGVDLRPGPGPYTRGMADTLVPAGFEVPTSFDGPGFRLEPLGPEHNERDHEAWTSSIPHIRSTPGFPDGSWPTPMSLERNRQDLVRHARDFEMRRGFTYTILDGRSVIGCVYIYPTDRAGCDAEVSSWVRESRAEMDTVVWMALRKWIGEVWPFSHFYYAERG
jgi:hypothetical protein